MEPCEAHGVIADDRDFLRSRCNQAIFDRLYGMLECASRSKREMECNVQNEQISKIDLHKTSR